jgi:hypothetical protein
MVTKDYQKGVYEWVTLGISDETCGVTDSGAIVA